MVDLFATKILSDDDFHFFKEKIFDLSGIYLSDAKKTLIQSRLNSQLEVHKFKTFSEYRKYLQNLSSSDDEYQKFVNLLTTNKTDWFREIEHFNYLQNDFIPKWLKLGKEKLLVWSAASSTGEEAYTLAMVLEKALKNSDKTFEIIGSDIDTNVISKASSGVYKKDQLENIPTEFHHHFSMGTQEIEQWMKIGKDLKKFVRFEQFNLISDDYSAFNKNFDLIFCRNVMIYFTPETIQAVADNCFTSTKDQGVLIISHTESLQNIKTKWKIKRPSVYTKGNSF